MLPHALPGTYEGKARGSRQSGCQAGQSGQWPGAQSGLHLGGAERLNAQAERDCLPAQISQIGAFTISQSFGVGELVSLQNAISHCD